MKMINYLACGFAAFVLFASACSDNKEAEIKARKQTLHLAKDLKKVDDLTAQLQHETAEIRAEAAFCLAAVGQSSTFNAIVEALKSETDSSAQKALAFALYNCSEIGQFNSGLIKELNAKITSFSAKEQWFRSLGHVADSIFLANEINSLVSGNQYFQARAYYEAAQRNLVNQGMFEILVQTGTDAKSSLAKKWASNALYRCARNQSKGFSNYTEAMATSVNYAAFDNGTLKRLFALPYCFGEDSTNNQLIVNKLLEGLNSSNDYRFRVESIRGLSKIPSIRDQASNAVQNLLIDENVHVSNTAAQFFVTAGSKEQSKLYLEWSSAPNLQWRTKSNLLAASYIHGGDTVKKESFDAIIGIINTSKNAYERKELMQILSNQPIGLIALESFLENAPTNMEKAVCLEGLTKIAENLLEKSPGKYADAMKIRIIKLLEEKCASKDEYIAYVAAQGLRSEILDSKNEIIDFSFLKKHIQNWPLPQYYETKIEFEKTFRYFQGEDPGSINSLKLEIPHNNPIDFAFLETKKNQSNTYTFKTNKGNFKMEFNYDQAPGTAIYIAKLIEEGFYNGKKFHRVIPNFVAQGGCPRGNGVGSTDKSLRSEFTYLEYEEGSVGMASAGRDTESCQFFITHHDVPHLNGRYSIFAKVVEGMDVVHKLTVGDTINEIVW